MDIRLTKSGRIFYHIQSELAALLCEALPSVFERVERPAYAAPALPLESEWGIVTLPASGKPALQHKRGAQVDLFDGQPDKAAAAFKSAGYAVPPEIVAQYRVAHGTPLPSVTVSDGERQHFESASNQNRITPAEIAAQQQEQ